MKHITFPEQVKADIAKGLCYGECHGVLWQGQNFKSVKKALQWMFESLGGFQVLSFCLAPMGTQQHGTRTNFFDNLGNEEIDAGFDFIERHGGKAVLQDLKKKNCAACQWEQWGGIVERGRPESLRLFRLKPKNTHARAPGPGPIKKIEWLHHGKPLLDNKKVILHTDGARAYKTPFTNVIRCHVVHQKKKAEKKGKVVWLNPSYTKVYDLKTSDGAHLKVKSGTQVIDRFWGELRRHLRHVTRLPGNNAMTRKIRSAQWLFWHKNDGLWQATGRMLRELREHA